MPRKMRPRIRWNRTVWGKVCLSFCKNDPERDHAAMAESSILGSPMQSRSFGIVSFQEYWPSLTTSVGRSRMLHLAVKRNVASLFLCGNRKSERPVEIAQETFSCLSLVKDGQSIKSRNRNI